jgi:hypothetical protein
MILAGRADRGPTDRLAAVVDRDDGMGPLVTINPNVIMDRVLSEWMGAGQPVGTSQYGRSPRSS